MPVTTTLRKETLKVPGATLYYEVRGAGPLLLLMPGGPADARIFTKIGGEMARDHTVVTYDPRGLSRSTLEEPIDEQRIVQIFADDVHHLLEATTDEPAYVLGVSGGATISLDLAARYGQQLKAVVAHEPPAAVLTPDPDKNRRDAQEVADTLRSQGLPAAMQKFAAMSRIRTGPPPPSQNPTPEELEGMQQMGRNMPFFLGPYGVAISRFEPDIEALKKGPARIIPGVGEDSKGELAHEAGLLLAQKLGTEAVVFPGAHGGFEEYPEEYAATLRQSFAKT